MTNTSYSHLKALLSKNWILFKRCPVGSCCEIVIPIVLVLLLAAIRAAVSIDNENETSYIVNATTFSFDSQIPIALSNYVNSLPDDSDVQIFSLQQIYANFHLKYKNEEFFLFFTLFF